MEKTVRDVVVVAYGRSAVAKAIKGSLKDTHPVDYAAQVLKGVLNQVPTLPLDQIDDFVCGCAYPERFLGNNFARQVAIRAGLPFNVAGQTINRFCSSGLQSIATAANAIAVGQGEIMLAGGTETMYKSTMTPDPQYFEKWNEENTDINILMGITAENVAKKYNISREDEDAFAVQSHAKAAFARSSGRFKGQIIPIEATDAEGNKFMFTEDECIREGTTAEKLAGLQPAFIEDGIVTAGNASQLSDGCGFVVLMAKEKAEELGIKPIARFVSYAVAGIDPAYMGVGPIWAIPKVLKQAGLSVDDIDIFELNEAFASQSLAVVRTLGLNPEKVNPNGGAIAMGHPLGGTGGILTSKLLAEMQRSNLHYGMVTMCIGGGMGAAGIFELL